MPNEELSGFIRSSFRSVWTLELLLLLKRERRGWSPEELLATLRGSRLIVSQGLETLLTMGMIASDDSGAVCYRPVNESLARLIDDTDALYARSPDQVRRLIASSTSGTLAAFADAFRFRRD
jgi:hypothetical protein